MTVVPCSFLTVRWVGAPGGVRLFPPIDDLVLHIGPRSLGFAPTWGRIRLPVGEASWGSPPSEPGLHVSNAGRQRPGLPWGLAWRGREVVVFTAPTLEDAERRAQACASLWFSDTETNGIEVECLQGLDLDLRREGGAWIPDRYRMGLDDHVVWWNASPEGSHGVAPSSFTPGPRPGPERPALAMPIPPIARRWTDARGVVMDRRTMRKLALGRGRSHRGAC